MSDVPVLETRAERRRRRKRGRLTSLGGTQLGDGCIITENNKRPHTISFFFCLADFLRKFQILRNNIDSFQIKYLILRSSFFLGGGCRLDGKSVTQSKLGLKPSYRSRSSLGLREECFIRSMASAKILPILFWDELKRAFR